MANILVIGSLKQPDEEQRKRLRQFAKYLGKEIVEREHCLYTGCMSELDRLIAKSAHDWVTTKKLYANDWIINYVRKGKKPAHQYGEKRNSLLADWTHIKRVRVPEQVENADVVVLVGGGKGTRIAAGWARIRDKPLLPVMAFGGTAQQVYEDELGMLKSNYRATHNFRHQFTRLSQLPSKELAKDVIKLAERLTSSREVCVLMSFSQDSTLIDALDSFREVCCEKNGYEKCEPINELTAEKKILEETKERIEKAAFIIADLTDERPNVYYELGYADGLGKRYITTARKGTPLHFNVQGNATLFWKGQKDLKKQLEEKMENMGLSRPPRPKK